MNKLLRGIVRWTLRGLLVFSILVVALYALGIGLFFWGLTSEQEDRREPAAQALQAVGLGSFEAVAPYYVLSGPDIRAFHLPEYDNHVDNTDVHTALLAHAATAEGWTVAPVTAAEYAAQLPPEAAFLLPDAALVFDASYHMGDTLAFFDDETGLMVCILPGKTPKARKIKAAGLSIPTDGRMYEMDTHGGFLGDGDAFKACVVPEQNRPALEAALAIYPDWHIGTISQAEYAQLHEMFYAVPELYPVADMTFDFWYYADDFARQYPDMERNHPLYSASFPAVMQEAGAVRSGNWTAAFYDEDSGLFIWYEFDS